MIMFGRKWSIFLLFSLVVTMFIPLKFWRLLLQNLQYCYDSFHWNEFLESSTLYYILNFRESYNLQKNSILRSDVVYPRDYYGASFYHAVINEVVRLHKNGLPALSHFYRQKEVHIPSRSLEMEALQSLKKAKFFQASGHYPKARKLLEHAFRLYPDNSDILVSLGEVIEASWLELNSGDGSLSALQQSVSPTSVSKFHTELDDPYELLLTADYLYTRALIVDPRFEKAEKSKVRLTPLIEEIDQRRFNAIDLKVRRFYQIPENNPGLRHAKLEHYFKHIYHSNAIEGNTLTLAQTRSILETRIAVGGKSLMEQNEVLGLDLALRYLNASLRGNALPVTLDIILELHKRILGFVDPIEAGQFRRTQVFIADHRPPPADAVPHLMMELVNWINSDRLTDVHPIELAALFHWKLVHIHPFYDGNGRTARLVMNLILMRSGFPPAIIKVEDRPAYYQHLKAANEGDVRPFIRFIASCTERTIDEYLEAASDGLNVHIGKPTLILPELSQTSGDQLPFNKCFSTPLMRTSSLQSTSSPTCHPEPTDKLQQFSLAPFVRFLPNVVYFGG